MPVAQPGRGPNPPPICLFLLAVKLNFVLDTQLMGLLINRELLNKYKIRTEVVLLLYSKMKKSPVKVKTGRLRVSIKNWIYLVLRVLRRFMLLGWRAIEIADSLVCTLIYKTLPFLLFPHHTLSIMNNN